ncbi:MAG: N-acyl homoserine lactonase family protein [Pseudomonadota bacterium]
MTDLLKGHRITRLTVLDFGLFDVAGKRTIGIPGYLLETDKGARVLVDTGFPPDYATDPEGAEARDGLSRFGRLIGFGAHQTAVGQLALLGLVPADITLLILTHGHIDHVGSLPLFPCPVVLTARERAEPKPLYFGGRQPMDWPDTIYHLIHAETDLCDGLRLIPTPGHTAGHVSLLVTLPQTGPVILAADAINRASEPAEGFADADDPVASVPSANSLFALRDTLGALLIYGHEPTQWSELRKAPAFYD